MGIFLQRINVKLQLLLQNLFALLAFSNIRGDQIDSMKNAQKSLPNLLNKMATYSPPHIISNEEDTFSSEPSIMKLAKSWMNIQQIYVCMRKGVGPAAVGEVL